MKRLLKFAASPEGRWTRIGIGSVLAAAALSRRVPKAVAIPAVGIALTGVFDIVPPARFAGLPISGAKLRRKLGLSRRPIFLR